MFQDYILNGQAIGEVGSVLQGMHFSPELMRPYLDAHNKPCVTFNTGKLEANKETGLLEPVFEKREVRDLQAMGVPVINATTTLRKDDWIRLDQAVLKETRQRSTAWADLAAANSFSVPGMSTPMLEHETMDDGNIDADVDMDGLSHSHTDDTPVYQLEGIPLPITHYGFTINARKLAASRNSGTPIDTTMAERAGRKVVETIEKTTIGILAGLQFKTASGQGYSNEPKVWGYISHPDRNTKTDLTTPTGSNSSSTVADVLTMIETLNADGYYGPFTLYYGTVWSQYMNNDYSVTSGTSYGVAPNMTLKQRLEQIDEISATKRLDFLTSANFPLILVQQTSDVARAVIGMQPTLVQWPSQGGMQNNFKVMAILVPQIRSTQGGNCGIVHATDS